MIASPEAGARLLKAQGVLEARERYSVSQLWFKMTTPAKRTLLAAEQEAVSAGSSTVMPEHLLLAMLGMDYSAAGLLLSRVGIDLENLRQEIRSRLPAREGATTQEVKLDQKTRRVLELAAEEWRQDGSKDGMGTEHLLLGIASLAEGIAYQALAGLGVHLVSLRSEMASLQVREIGSRPTLMRFDGDSGTPAPDRESTGGPTLVRNSPWRWPLLRWGRRDDGDG